MAVGPTVPGLESARPGAPGHVSLETTNIYAETDLEMKAKALAMCEVASEPKNNKRWREDPQLMTLLRSL
jgi:hypothetical protein